MWKYDEELGNIKAEIINVFHAFHKYSDYVLKSQCLNALLGLK